METLQVSEIYKSIQGESTYSGLPCTFIRLTGCPLRCRWCDTTHAFTGGVNMTIDSILGQVDGLGVKLVELTGGEPLAQKLSWQLVDRLFGQGHQVLIETGGSESIQGLHEKTHIIMDVKCPGSHMEGRNLWENFDYLKSTDEVKFVIASRSDFEWAVECATKYDLASRFLVLFSPAFGLLDPKDLAAWLLESKLSARMQLQIHKYIWNPRAKGV